MRRFVTWATLVIFSSQQTLGVAAPADEAAANAAAANITIQGFITKQSATEVVPGYTETPPETGYYATPNLNVPAQSQVTNCATATDPSCEAVTTGVNSAATPKPNLGQYDPEISQTRDIAANPGALLGDLSPYYSGCTVTTVPVAAGTETKKCQRYAGLGRTGCSSKFIASPDGSGTWEDGCASLNANNGYGSCTKVTGPTCIEGPSTKTIGGVPVYAACWEYESTFNCGDQASVDECAPLISQGCTISESRCIKAQPEDPNACAVRQESYECPRPAGTTTVVSNCSSAACTTKPTVISPPVFDRQSCFTYLMRSLGSACSKSLDVDVTWTCPSGSTSGPTRDDAPPDKGTWTCVKPTTEKYCEPPLTGPSESGFCINPDTGESSAAPTRTVDKTVSAIAVETDIWDNGCAGYEARVPPGLLPPDGDPGPVGPATGPGPVNKCERASTTCTVPPETRVINDHPVARSCWGYTNTFDCVENDNRSDCEKQPPVGQCTQLGDPVCVDQDDFFDPPVCTAWRKDFQCQIKDATYGTVQDCGPEQPSADVDFARTVAFLEAGREAGRYMDPATLRVFNGYKGQCKKRFFGITNCCKSTGTDSQSMFNNLSMANTASTIYKNAFSTYTYDALFVSDAPTWVLNAFETLAGGSTGFSSALAGVASGDISFMSFLGNLSLFTWIAIIIFILQMAGVFDCEEEAQVTAMKRDAHLCADIGEYCSKRLAVIRTCVTRTHTYCCFNSRLARLINEQGRAQLGLPWGSAKNPRCEGFTIPQLQSLNFAAMDLTEFYADIVPTMPNVSSAISNQTGRVNNCYFGQGKCQ